jgi:hypothetical protein
MGKLDSVGLTVMKPDDAATTCQLLGVVTILDLPELAEFNEQ